MPLAELCIPKQLYDYIPQTSAEFCEAALAQVQKYLQVPAYDVEWRIVHKPEIGLDISCTMGDEYEPGRPFEPNADQLTEALGAIATINSALRPKHIRFMTWENTGFFMRGQKLTEEKQLPRAKAPEEDVFLALALILSPDREVTESEFEGLVHGILGLITNMLNLPEDTPIDNRIEHALAAQTDYTVEVDLSEEVIFSQAHLEAVAHRIVELLNEGSASAWVRQGSPAIYSL